ncbi:riboflavin biosynthesis protein RibA [Legionella nautarum]|uniref:Riboflavin biosynthesis protein RibBA n=1 Tax=Legionella nautarum TaxID=45070 RepID=A0A0W0WUV6_9GAMM|nr:bifunctional 3,4-dihydroxy-2-butanone-4-phosphate synthase/GTP cyclohydrolase II [Legionella nautarum]KTD36068.1 riboflavin biosynthesis protein RibA [Legionella nautarum]
MTKPFATIEEAIAALKAGRMIILLDDEARENEGDLVIAAEYATPEAINFMARFGRGLICLSMASEYIDKLELPMMAKNNRSPYGTAFTVSIEAASGVSTGISAQDRAHTISVAISADTQPKDLISPGHVFPLRARDKGVLERQGQTEGSVDLARLAGLKPAAVICEIINEDGTMSRRDELALFSQTHNLPMVTIKDLIEYRIRHERLVEEIATTQIPLHGHGDFAMTVFHNKLDSAEHFALIKEPVHKNQVPLVRIHSECITGDVFGSCKCDCGKQLQQSLAQIGKEGGVLIYLRQEGRGIGLANKLKAYALQEKGYDTVDANLQLGLPADNRDYSVAFQILKYLGVEALRLLTNNPKKVEALEKYGLKVTERLALSIHPTPENKAYLKTKQQKLGHLLTIE